MLQTSDTWMPDRDALDSIKRKAMLIHGPFQGDTLDSYVKCETCERPTKRWVVLELITKYHEVVKVIEKEGPSILNVDIKSVPITMCIAECLNYVLPAKLHVRTISQVAKPFNSMATPGTVVEAWFPQSALIVSPEALAQLQEMKGTRTTLTHLIGSQYEIQWIPEVVADSPDDESPF